jgi:outer membrane protein insertion porin family
MGMNRALYTDLFYSLSEESYKLIYEEKNLFNYFIQSKTTLFHERTEPISTDEWYEEQGISLHLSKKFGSLTVGVGSSFSLKNSDTYKGVDNYLNSYSGFITYDKRSNLIRPKFGYYGNFTALNSLNFTEDYDKFIKFELDNRGYYTLGNLTIAAALRNGYISSPYEDLVSTDQLFLLGGTTTIRGYGENLAYKSGDEGNSDFEYSLFNLELRLETLFNIETIGFYDMGSLGSLSFDQYKSSYGGGIGYITPFGSITLYYGMKVDPVEGEDDGRWHFSIGYLF